MTPAGEGGLVHLALLHDGPDDLVAGALAEVRRALADGDEVLLVGDRATARAFHEALGDDAARVAFPPPSSMLPPSDPGFLAAARGWVRPGRRTTVLGQYPAAMPASACRVGEDGLNVVRRDLPLTLICCCRRNVDPELVAVARRTHPHLAAKRAGAASTGDLLSHLRPFCTCAAVHEDAGRRAVRVLTTV